MPSTILYLQTVFVTNDCYCKLLEYVLSSLRACSCIPRTLINTLTSKYYKAGSLYPKYANLPSDLLSIPRNTGELCPACRVPIMGLLHALTATL